MWKLLFETFDRVFAIIPVKRFRNYLRIVVLFDYRNKLNALKSAYPKLNFKHMKLAKGGGSIVFIIDNKYIFKVRKHNSEAFNFERFIHEKHVTDALRPYCNIKIPKIDLINIGKYTFYKSDYIPGIPLVNIPFHKIKQNQTALSKQLAMFIYQKSLAQPTELHKKIKQGYSWVHGDMCSNILVNKKSMKITGIIDWEWANYRPTTDEFEGIVWVRKKMRKTNLDKTTQYWYNKYCFQPKQKTGEHNA